MRDYGKTWVDQHGKTRQVPQILGRLKCGKIPLHRDLRTFVLQRDGFKCQVCGVFGCDPADPQRDLPMLVHDHILSRRNGGSHHPNNLRALCDSCNAIKANTIDRLVGR